MRALHVSIISYVNSIADVQCVKQHQRKCTLDVLFDYFINPHPGGGGQIVHLAFISSAVSRWRAGCILPNPVNNDGKYDEDYTAIIDNNKRQRILEIRK